MSCKKTILLFSESYPLGGISEEAFIIPELRMLAEHFDRVVLVPTSRIGNEQASWRVSNNIALVTNYADAHIGSVSKRSVLFHPKVLLKFLNGKEDVKRQLQYCYFRKFFNDLLSKEGISIENVIAYTFWLAKEAEFVGRFALEYGLFAISRAHRFDIFDYPNTQFRKNALRGLRLIFPCSQDGLNALRIRYPYLSEKLCVSYLGVAKNVINALNPTPSKASEITFFSCHNLIKRKRGLLCATCLRQLAINTPNINFRWILVGDGEEKGELDKIAATLPQNIKFDFRGALPNSEVHDIFIKEPIDFAILLSESEGLPVMLLEALSYGIPVIGTDVGGTRECFERSVGVLLPKDIEENQFVGMIQPLVYQDRLHMRQCAYNTFLDTFNATNNRKEFVEKISISIDS